MIARKVLVVSRATALAKEVQAAAGSSCIVTHYPYVGDIEEYVDLKGPFDMLVAGPLFDTKAGMERLRRLREANDDLPVLLALDTPVRCALPDVIRVGAADLIELPADRRRLATAIKRTLESKREALPEPDADEEWDTPLAEVISIASPSGGCGKTFYSTNLSHFLSRTTGKRICLVDLDLQFGEVMTALRLKPRYTMVDAVVRSDEEASTLDTYIEEYLVHHDSGFAVLPAPRHPAEADRITMPDITRIVSALRRHFDYVIIDTSAQLSEVTLTALEQSTALICMATVDLPSIRNMRVFLDTLERLNVPTDRVTVILNKVEPDMGIRLEEVDEALHHKVVSVLPYAREVSRSINQGQPVMVTDPKSDISRKLAAGMQIRIGGSPDGIANRPAGEVGLAADAKRWRVRPPTTDRAEVQPDAGPARASRLWLKVLKKKEEVK